LRISSRRPVFYGVKHGWKSEYEENNEEIIDFKLIENKSEYL
jgi:hypothetical protein